MLHTIESRRIAYVSSARVVGWVQVTLVAIVPQKYSLREVMG